jgi:hypothetical protein
MNMDSLSFNPFTLDERASVVIEDGTYVSTAYFSDVEILLYRYHNEFVEIWYSVGSKRLLRLDNLTEKKINPFLKHLTGFNLN